MDFNTYQNEAVKTAGDSYENDARLCWALGLTGEAGEVAELVKKHFFHSRDMDREKLVKELGDTLWYLSICALSWDIPLEEIAQANLAKLRARYPEGFQMGGGNR